MKRQKKKPIPPQKYCACGCNEPTNYHKGSGYSKFLKGHFFRKKRELIPCACGECKEMIITIPASTSHYRVRYIQGHHLKGKPSANRGKKFSKEWRHNMSIALIKSWINRKKKL